MEHLAFLVMRNESLVESLNQKADVFYKQKNYLFYYIDKNPKLLTDDVEEQANNFQNFFELLEETLIDLKADLCQEDCLETQTALSQELPVILDTLRIIQDRLNLFFYDYIPEV